jgi:hypothetical protein
MELCLHSPYNFVLCRDTVSLATPTTTTAAVSKNNNNNNNKDVTRAE